MPYKNGKECICFKTTCSNHGKCCDCVIKHRTTDSLPYCLSPDNGGDKSNRKSLRGSEEKIREWNEVIKIINETYSVEAEYLWDGETESKKERTIMNFNNLLRSIFDYDPDGPNIYHLICTWLLSSKKLLTWILWKPYNKDE